MKKSVISLLFLFCICTIKLTAQPKQMGWYFLQEGAKTKVLKSYIEKGEWSGTDIKYAVDEVLMFFDFQGTKGYAIDIDGRILEVQDISKIKKIETEGKVVKMLVEIDLSLNKKLNKENNVWLVGFNSANNTAKILLSDGNIYEIPKASYIDLKDYFLKKGSVNQIYDVML
jgi:hypothetical protein